jgi:aryl-alcohol dehydrogenase-like predicted oxidoreductase
MAQEAGRGIASSRLLELNRIERGEKMEFIKIRGGIDRRVSRVGLGTWAIGGWMWGGSDEKNSIKTILTAFERGINLLDTAPAYGMGLAETIVGKAVADYGRRDEIVIATKVGLEWTADGSVRRNSGAGRIAEEIENSLKRLRTDYIDIYQVHWPDPLVPVQETAAALNRLYRQGKIRAIGVSNYSVKQMTLFREAAPLHTAQPPYNLFERGVEKNVLPYCRGNGISTLAYGALCRGLLSGRMRADTKFAGDDIRGVDPKFRSSRYIQYLSAVARLDRFARENYGREVIHLAVRWLLDQPGVSVALWGARRPDQLAPVDEVMGWFLDQAALDAIDKIVAESVADPVGPEFMAPPARDAAGDGASALPT